MNTRFTGKYLLNRVKKATSVKPVCNIYHATVQKTGSQWIKTIFKDSFIENKTGLTTFPQHRYEWDQFRKKFPKYSFVPGLYISYQLYEEIIKPDNYKTLYIYRDPRDLIISWYYSMKYSHGLMGKVYKHRHNLEKLSEEEGISYCIKHFHLKLSFMKDWYMNCNDSNVIFVKFENLTSSPVEEFYKIFREFGFEITKDELSQVLENYTKEKMRNKEKNKGKISHYRSEKKTWEDLFTKDHIKLFKEINGNIVSLLGYD